ncbi:DUF1858 domain-containing protein [Candidatus Woesearchaeota archaeon]|nr:DUF1858 domain-containing protein [Candidatus Woesearchaeota archaeon]
MAITKDMNFADILEKNENAAEILAKHGMHCVGCMMATVESLEDGCRAHGMNDEEIEKIVKELNDSE